MNASTKLASILLLVAALPSAAARAAEPAPASPAVVVDVPVKLESAKVAFNMDHLAFQGDLPVGVKYMGLFADRMKEQRVPAEIVGVFHGEAGYMLLNDAAYNRVRKVSTGNPLKELFAALVAKGVQLEECAVTMRGNGWTNKDLLPGVKVNTGAVIRLVELQQQGYAQIQP
jgi:intracellular sulfur oxidation DsrE/DsrF family protein